MEKKTRHSKLNLKNTDLIQTLLDIFELLKVESADILGVRSEKSRVIHEEVDIGQVQLRMGVDEVLEQGSLWEHLGKVGVHSIGVGRHDQVALEG